LDALKKGQQLAQEEAVRNGILDPSRLRKKWIGVMDERERESHRQMEGESVPYNFPYSNGQMIPGESEYNCRCLSRFYESRP
jgi:starvation-inducible outer membrane lipoprotein